MPTMKTPTARFFPILALLAAAAVAQAPDQGPQPDPQLPARLKELKDLVGDKKAAMDFQAIGLIQVLTKEPDKLNAKDKEKIAKALGDVFRAGKVRAADQDIL